MKIKDMFRAALKSLLTGTLTQTRLSNELGIATPLMSAYLSGTKFPSDDRQEMIAAHLGKTHFEMLEIGKKILEGEESELIAMDPAIKILLEAEKRAGAKLSGKKRDKAIEILRTGLQKLEETEIENITNMIKVINE